MELTASRTNTVIVPDLDELIAEFKRYGLSAEKADSATEGDLLYRIVEINETGSLVSFHVEGYVPGLEIEDTAYRLDLDEHMDIHVIPHKHEDVPALIASHIAEDQILIMIGADINKLAFVNSYGVVMDRAGRRRTIQLLDAVDELAKSIAAPGQTITEPYPY